MHTDERRKLLSCLWCFLSDSCCFHQRRTWTRELTAGACFWRKATHGTHVDSSSAHVKVWDLLTQLLVGSECMFGMCEVLGKRSEDFKCDAMCVVVVRRRRCRWFWWWVIWFIPLARVYLSCFLLLELLLRLQLRSCSVCFSFPSPSVSFHQVAPSRIGHTRRCVGLANQRQKCRNRESLRPLAALLCFTCLCPETFCWDVVEGFGGQR